MIVVFGFDEGFALPTGVALRSLDRFLSSSDQVLLLHDSVPGKVREHVRACISTATATEVDCSTMIDRAWRPVPWLSRASYLRYLAPALLDGEERALYLDGDVVVRHDPTPLHDHDLSGTTLAAVRSRVAPFAASPGGIMRWRELGVPSASPYFNSGVYVMDLARWRDRDVTGQITTFLERHGEQTFIPDQEALNVAVVGDWVEVDRTWNYVTHVAESFLQLPEAEPQDPCIVHFAGRQKPWTAGAQPLFAEDWHALVLDTPWAGFTPPSPAPTTVLTRGRHALARLVDRARRAIEP